MHKNLSENNSKYVGELERNIVNKTLSRNSSMEVTYNIITEFKDEEHKEPSATVKLNIYECGRNLLELLDVTYQWAFMATPKGKYYNAFLDNLVKDNNIRGKPLSNQKIQQEVSDIIQ